MTMEKNDKETRKHSKQHRTKLNFIVDLVLLIFMIAMILTGIIIHQVLPPGTGGEHGGTGVRLWDMNRHDFGDLHTYFAVGFIGTLLLHVGLHWTWVCRAAQRILSGSAETKRFTPQVTTGFGLGMLLLTVACIGGLVWSLSPVVVTTPGESAGNDTNETSRQPEDFPNQKPGARSHQKATTINGSMTLAEVSAQTGVSVKTLKHDLHLPISTSPNERLGRLRRRYGFEIEDVRHLVVKKGE